MIDTHGEASSTQILRVPRFHGKRGEDYNMWSMRPRAASKIKILWDAILSSCTCSEGRSSEIALPVVVTPLK